VADGYAVETVLHGKRHAVLARSLLNLLV